MPAVPEQAQTAMSVRQVHIAPLLAHPGVGVQYVWSSDGSIGLASIAQSPFAAHVPVSVCVETHVEEQNLGATPHDGGATHVPFMQVPWSPLEAMHAVPP